MFSTLKAPCDDYKHLSALLCYLENEFSWKAFLN